MIAVESMPVTETETKLKDRITCPACGADVGPSQPQLEDPLFKCPKCGAWIDSRQRPVKDVFNYFKKKRQKEEAA
jgi:predicted RNA-binding Zn-ribbon protein involved in translation (DUF1610 family)